MPEQRPDIYDLVSQVLQTLDDKSQAEEGTGAEGEVQHLYVVSKEELDKLVQQPDQAEEVAATLSRIQDVGESQLPTQEGEQEKEETQVTRPVTVQKNRQVKLSSALIPLVLLFILATGPASYLFALPTLATASVTIVPTAKSVHQVFTVPIATSPSIHGVQGRRLQDISLTKSVSVPATGHAHEDARTATGEITFYNTDVSPVTIPAGVTFTVNGIDIITNDTVTIPAATPPIDAQATTYAHAGSPGTAGNIPAKAIYTKCCGAQVYATNLLSFLGGQDERSYSYVQTSDIRNASQDMLSGLTRQATTALHTQLHTSEQLITPLCTPRTTADHQPGEEVTQVNVTLVQTCKSIAYNSASLQNGATHVLAASEHLEHYRRAGTTELTVTKATTDGTRATITVSVSGTWVYVFSHSQLTHLRTMIAGKRQKNAQVLLEDQPGIQQATIQVQRLDFKDTLPTNPDKISILFFYVIS